VFIVFLIAYTAGLVAALRLSDRASVRTGVATGAVAIIANIGALVIGAPARAWIAPVVAILAAFAASKAFVAADAGARDDELERHCNQAGQSLIAVAIAEAMIALVAGFVWAIN
jgi:hypothetical protein